MKTISKITLIAFLWITVINSGTLGVLDTELRLQMAHSWWTGTEEVQVAPDYKPRGRTDIRLGVVGVGGKRYIAYEPGQSMLMLPGDWLGTQLHQWFPILPAKDFRALVVSLLIFIPLNVAVVVSCFWLLRLFNFEERIAGLASIAWLLGTTVLHYSQVHHQNNQVLLFVTLGYANALAFLLRQNPRFLIWSGLSLGAAMLIRVTSAIHAFTVVLFLFGCAAYQNRNTRKVIKVIGLWIVGFIPLAFLGRLLDYIRYGNFLTHGQSLQLHQINPESNSSNAPKIGMPDEFSRNRYPGLWGVFFSPAKSIFIYDPLLLPGLVLAIRFWRRLSPYLQWYLVTGILNLGIHIILTSRLGFWHGDNAWGARYHLTSVHLLLIPLTGLFIQHLLSAKGVKVWLLRGILSLAILFQIASVAMPMNLEIYQANVGMPGSRLELRIGQRLINIVCLSNGSLSKFCVNSNPDKRPYLNHLNHLNFLPFTLRQEAANNPDLGKVSLVFLIVWGLVLILAIGTTVWFCGFG